MNDVAKAYLFARAEKEESERKPTLIEKMAAMPHVSICPEPTKPQLNKIGEDLYKCPLCPKEGDFARLFAHLQGHSHCVKRAGFSIFRCNLGCMKLGHYHCRHCARVFGNRDQFLRHLYKCEGVNESASPLVTGPTEPPLVTGPTEPPLVTGPTEPPLVTGPTEPPLVTGPSTSPPRVEKTTCCIMCNLTLSKKNLKVHMRRQHPEAACQDVNEQNCLPSLCIDPRKGIFAVAKTLKGPRSPIHVQKCTWGNDQVVLCELETCNRVRELSLTSGPMEFECRHLRSLAFSPASSADTPLEEDVLKEMGRNKWFGEGTIKMCLNRKLMSEREGTPLSKEVNFDENSKHIFISVFEPKRLFNSRLGRVMVQYKRKQKTWDCACTKIGSSCPHKAIGKWHLFQTHPKWFRKVKTTAAPIADPDSFDDHLLNVQYPPQGTFLTDLVQYIHSHKRLPAVLPQDVCGTLRAEDLPRHLIPCETFCAICPGRTLSEPVLITQTAKVIMMSGVVQDVSTYYRYCSLCGNCYRYQEWKGGLHNFDDHIILSLHLCLFLRNTIQSHTSVVRVISDLEESTGILYPSRDVILHAYLHFEALTTHEYEYSCVHCGHNPPVVIMDLHKETVSSMAVSDNEEPPPDFRGEVDTENIWSSTEREILCRGFLKGNEDNPFLSKAVAHSLAALKCVSLAIAKKMYQRAMQYSKSEMDLLGWELQGSLDAEEEVFPAEENCTDETGPGVSKMYQD